MALVTLTGALQNRNLPRVVCEAANFLLKPRIRRILSSPSKRHLFLWLDCHGIAFADQISQDNGQEVIALDYAMRMIVEGEFEGG